MFRYGAPTAAAAPVFAAIEIADDERLAQHFMTRLPRAHEGPPSPATRFGLAPSGKWANIPADSEVIRESRIKAAIE
jgi:hypothetical protein